MSVTRFSLMSEFDEFIKKMLERCRQYPNVLQLAEEHSRILECAKRRLGFSDPLAVKLDEDLQEVLMSRTKRRRLSGFDSNQLIPMLAAKRGRQSMAFGFACCPFTYSGVTIRVAALVAPILNDGIVSLCGTPEVLLWLVERTDARQFHRHLRKLLREQTEPRKPLLPASQMERLWSETIGFLVKSRRARRHIKAVARHRCLLLAGPPGVGKSTAANYLGFEAARRRFNVAHFTAAELPLAVISNRMSKLIKERGAEGLFICCDDVDAGVLCSDDSRAADKASFLSALDSSNKPANSTVCWLLTSNVSLDLSMLDKRLTRPGRIDAAMCIKEPDDQVRLRFYQEYLESELRVIGEEIFLQDTRDMTIAELDELRAICAQLYEDDRLDWTTALKRFDTRLDARTDIGGIGFSQSTFCLER